MKKKSIKSVISVLLCAVLTLAVPLSAVGATLVYYPVVYVAGATEGALYENPNRTQSAVKFGFNDASFISNCLNIMSSLVLGKTGASAYSTVSNEIGLMLSPIACKADGTPANPNIGPWSYNLPLSYYEGEEIDTPTLRAIIDASAGKITADDVYVFTSDWRLDPMATAGKLKEYIDVVLASTGSARVTLLCGGFGGTVGEAYLTEYAAHAKTSVDSVTFLNCPLWGNANIGDLMSGQLYQTAGDASSLTEIIDIVDGKARGEAFTAYLKDDPDAILSQIFNGMLGEGAFSELLTMFIKLLIGSILDNENIDRDLGKAYNSFLMSNEDQLYSDSLGKFIRNMPGLWALVPEADFQNALDRLFGTEIINSDLYDTIISFRGVMENIDYTLARAKADGIKVYVVVNYGIQNLPLTASVDAESDGSLTTRTASAGATTLECPRNWEGYDRCTNVYHDHMDPNAEIDASTCALPENTWFVKNLSHMDYSCPTAATFLVWLMTSSVQRTVWDNNFYTQYMNYNKYSNAITAFTNITDVDNNFAYGDYDFDGDVDVEDARTVLRVAIGLDDKPSKFTLVVGDVNGDGYIGVDDARLILRYAIGLDHFFDLVQ